MKVSGGEELVSVNARAEGVRNHDGGPLLVLGGPGTGKTTAIEQRYLRLARELAPHRVLILCGSRWYSTSAKDRLFWRLDQTASVQIPVYTWHALAYHLVTRYHPRLGYTEAPVLLTAAEQWGVVRELLAAEDPVGWPHWKDRLRDRGFVDEVADFCLRVQQRMLHAEALQALGEHRSDWAEVVRFYDRYQSYLRMQSRLDYAGLIGTAAELLGKDAEVREALHRRFPHVLVDDGQELSEAHLSLLGRLDISNLVVAADPDSGIERFRGAEPDWVYGFEKRFGNHATVVLPASHRLGEPLLSAASDLISHNEVEAAHRAAESAPHSTSYEAHLYTSASEEVDAIARELRRIHIVEGVPWRDLAVLVSQPAYLLKPLERALDRWEVPYAPLAGDRPLTAEPLVATILDLQRVALELEGWETLLPDVLTSPLVGMQVSTRRSLERQAWQDKCSLLDLVEASADAQEFRTLRDAIAENAAHADECFWEIYRTSSHIQGLVARAVADADDPCNSEVDALVSLSHSIGRFVERRHGRGGVSEYLSEAARADFGADPWLPSPGGTTEQVEVVSFHGARGKQWHTVIVAGCLDAWIPKGRRAQGLFDPFALEIAEAVDREVEAIADDRRTFYVAATRATNRTVFTVSPGPSGRGRPTRFLSEMSGQQVGPAPERDQRPLTLAEFRANLRRLLAREEPDHEKVAAVLGLAAIPGTDPSRWYGRWGWTEGAFPLATRGEFRTSYSRLSAYENCGLQYVLQSVLGLDPASTHSMKFGTWIHALFQAVHERKINDIPTLKREYRNIFDERVFPNKTIAAQFRRDGERMLKAFWEQEYTQENVHCEINFEIPFHGATLRGRIDRIDQKGKFTTLTDYKTAKWAPSRQDAEESLQLAIYFLAARTDPVLKELGEPTLARLVYPGATWADGQIRALKQNKEQADEVLARLPELLDRVIEEDFNPSPDADCFFCRMKPLCPLWPEGREVEA